MVSTFTETLFPSPLFNDYTPNNFKDNIIYIPNTMKGNEQTVKYHIPCLFIKPEKETINTIIYFHGNAEDIFLSWGMANGICQKLQMNVLVVEYPGYSLYKADKDTEIIKSNAVHIYNYIKNELSIKDENIFIYGRSIGSGIAIYLASKENPAALFLVSAFTSIKDIASSMVTKVLSWLVKESFDSITAIQQVKCPTIFIHGIEDTLIEVEQSKQLYVQCNSAIKEIKLPPRMTHNYFFFYHDILTPIKLFIENNKLCQENESKCVIPSYLYNQPNDIQQRIENSIQNQYTVSKVECQTEEDEQKEYDYPTPERINRQLEEERKIKMNLDKLHNETKKNK